MTKQMPKRQEPEEAFAKLKFLREFALPRRFPGSKPTETDLAKHIVNPRTGCAYARETLRDQMKYPARLSTEVQSALARTFDFSLGWQEWNTGTAAEFEERYKSAHPDRQPSAPDRPGLKLERGPRQAPTSCRIEGLVEVYIDGAQFGSGTVAIEVTVSCGTPIILHAQTTIRSGRIALKCHPAVLTRDALDGWLTGPRTVQGSSGSVRISFEAGSRGMPAWGITADGTSIGTIRLDPDFAALEELAPGDTITLEFGTWLPEIQETSSSEDESPIPVDGIALVGSDSAEIEVPRAALSKLKQRIIACIRKNGMLPAHDNGYVVLASHALKVIGAKS